MHCTCIWQSIVTNNHCIGMAKTSIYDITGMTDEIAAEIANLFAKPSTDASIIFAWNFPEIDVFINSRQQYAGQYQPLFDINGIQNARHFALKFLSHLRIIVPSMYLFSEILYASCVLILSILILCSTYIILRIIMIGSWMLIGLIHVFLCALCLL